LVAVTEEDPKLLRNIEKSGLKPGTMIKVVKSERDGLLVIVHGEKIFIKEDMAASLFVKRVRDKEVTCALDETPLSRLASGQTGVIKSYAGGRGMLGAVPDSWFYTGKCSEMLKIIGTDRCLLKCVIVRSLSAIKLLTVYWYVLTDNMKTGLDNKRITVALAGRRMLVKALSLTS